MAGTMQADIPEIYMTASPVFYLVIACAAATGLAFAGMLALSMAMDRHHEQMTGRYDVKSVQRWLARAGGAGLIAASMWACIAAWGATVGFVAWWGFLTAGALFAVVILSYRPRWSARVAAVVGALAAVSVLTMVFWG